MRVALSCNEPKVAALMAVARLFLLRVPSEGVPLQWDGDHSSISLEPSKATITLVRRKNSKAPVTLSRDCCCRSSGRKLCAVCWLHYLRRLGNGQGRVFDFTRAHFASCTKRFSTQLGFPEASYVGTHSFRRGMAQDILDHGGSLSVLLRAGDWSSSAFLAYLRQSQPSDVAVAQTVIQLSDSEADS